MASKFLLIDDDADDRELFCEAINAIDEQITCYSETNGRRALEKLDNREIEPPDVIFLDVNMPVMNGWQCLSALKSNETYKNIPVIIYSTSSHAHEVEKAHDHGALYFMTKPSDFKTLTKNLEMIANLIKANSLHLVQPGSLFPISSA